MALKSAAPRAIPNRSLAGGIPAAAAAQQDFTPGFKLATEPVRPRIIVATDGLEKSGKNHFAFTAPAPIYTLSFDTGLEGTIQKFQKDKEIYVKDYMIPRPQSASKEAQDRAMKEADAVWDLFLNDYAEALSKARTIIADTGTEMWELLRICRLGKLDGVKPHHYGPVNAEYRTIIREAYANPRNVNLIILHKLKAEYKNDKRTDKMERAGFSDTGYMVQANLHHFRDATGAFCTEIAECRHDPELTGVVLSGDDNNFMSLAMQMIPDSDPGEWL